MSKPNKLEYDVAFMWNSEYNRLSVAFQPKNDTGDYDQGGVIDELLPDDWGCIEEFSYETPYDLSGIDSVKTTLAKIANEHNTIFSYIEEIENAPYDFYDEYYPIGLDCKIKYSHH